MISAADAEGVRISTGSPPTIQRYVHFFGFFTIYSSHDLLVRAGGFFERLWCFWISFSQIGWPGDFKVILLLIYSSIIQRHNKVDPGQECVLRASIMTEFYLLKFIIFFLVRGPVIVRWEREPRRIHWWGETPPVLVDIFVGMGVNLNLIFDSQSGHSRVSGFYSPLPLFFLRSLL